MKKIILIKSAVPVFLFGILALTGLVSCTSTQGMYSENDGIYESTTPPVRTKSEQVVIINDGSGQKYQKYFETEANNIYTGEDEIFTNIDTYSSYNDTLQGNIIINNYYNEGAAPWGYTDEYATVNINMGYGGYWGYPYYGFYNMGYGGYWGYGGYGGYGGYWGYDRYWFFGGYWGGYYPPYAGFDPLYPPYYGNYTHGKRSNYLVSRSSDVSITDSDSGGSGRVINDNTKIAAMNRTGEGLTSTNRKVISDFSQRTRYVQASQTANRESLIANAMSTNKKVMANFNDRAKYVRSSIPKNSNNSGQTRSDYSRLNDSNSNNAPNNNNSGQRSSSKSSGNSESRSSNNRQSASDSAPAYNSSSGVSSGGGSYSRPSSGGSNNDKSNNSANSSRPSRD